LLRAEAINESVSRSQYDIKINEPLPPIGRRAPKFPPP
jgi:hypothetical protein